MGTLTGSILLFIGTFAAPSSVRVHTEAAPFHSVAYYDNQTEQVTGESLTNSVLDRSVASGIVRDATNLATMEFDANKALRYKEQVQQHCNLRLKFDKIPNPALECGGAGFTR